MPDRGGKRDALEQYVQDHQQDFYRFAYSYVKNGDAALDVVQEAIVKGLTKAHTMRDLASIKPWFYRILVNESINYIRKNKWLSLEETDAVEAAALERDIPQALDLYQAVQRLEPKLKTVVLLRFFEDMKLEDIAKATDTNLNTVKSRLYTSLKRLREWIGEEEGL